VKGNWEDKQGIEYAEIWNTKRKPKKISGNTTKITFEKGSWH
jgi:hypothetical protein